MRRLLQRHVDYPSGRQVVMSILFTSLACCLILVLFQPFGVNNYDPSESLRFELIIGVSAFGVTMIAAFLFNEFLIRPFVVKRYTVLSVLAWLAWTVILGGSVSYLTYNVLGEWHDWNLSSYLEFVRNWFLLTAFPLGLVVLYLRQHDLHRKLREVQVDRRGEGNLFIFTSDNQKDKIALPLHDILYIESEDNYVQLTYYDGEKVSRYLLRSTLKRLEKELDHTAIARCHRSFLVNLDNVQSFRGNAHRVDLTLKHTAGTVPVSRKFTAGITDRLKRVKE